MIYRRMEGLLNRASTGRMHSGSLEALKWAAVFFMVLDHVNLHLLNQAYPGMYELGRLALPLFVFVLSYNLAQADGENVLNRTLSRLIPISVIAILPHAELNFDRSGLVPLNILFTLGSGIAVVALLEHSHKWGGVAAGLLFLGMGSVVEYGWVGIGLFVSAWLLFKKTTMLAMITTATLLVLLGYLYNGSQWALMSIPMFLLGFWVRAPVPRLRGALYFFYPAHLVVIAAFQILLPVT